MRKLYHGTSDVFLEKIRKKGLCPPVLGEKGGEFFEKEHPNTVYFTDNYDSAFAIAWQTVYMVGGKPLVFEAEEKSLKNGKLVHRKGIEVAVRTKKCIPFRKFNIRRDKPQVGIS